MMTETEEVAVRAVLEAHEKLLADQREANQGMVQATILADELREHAEGMANELRESEERYRTLFDMCPVAVYSCDVSGAIQNFNHHAVELWGRTPTAGAEDDRFCGSYRLFQPDGSYLSHAACPMADVVSGEIPEVRDAELVIERPGGSRVTVIVNIRPLKDAAGAVVGAINCFYDITRRKEAEKETADSLLQERLLAEFREMFIGILGHDLRNPLSAIIMSAARMLRRGRLDELDGDQVSRIIRCSQRISRMTTELLDLTRARLGGGMPIKAQAIDLGDVCRNVVDEFDAPIELHLDGNLQGMWDEDRLAEVLSNIIGNGLRYSAQGSPVTVHAHAEETGVVVVITNRGDPIPPDVVSVLFEPFRRGPVVGPTTSRGLGLGLYIAKQIVVAHGGTISVHSADGSTSFAIRLPRRPPEVPGA